MASDTFPGSVFPVPMCTPKPRSCALIAALALAAGCQHAAKPAPPSAVDHAAAWMAAFPIAQLRFDAAIALGAIRVHHDTDALRVADEHARAVADRDPDNPLRRAFDDADRAPPASTAGWTVPAPGAPRINVNRVVGEALHCKENGLRAETLAYATGAMRDQGGYQTTHALWALAIARDRGCLPDFEARARPVIDELYAAEPPAPEPAVLALDLFAERLLMLELAGVRGPEVDGWAASLEKAQSPDGGFGTLAPGQEPYFRFHATMMATWALVAHVR